jgi:hypothetical protein
VPFDALEVRGQERFTLAPCLWVRVQLFDVAQIRERLGPRFERVGRCCSWCGGSRTRLVLTSGTPAKNIVVHLDEGLSTDSGGSVLLVAIRKEVECEGDRPIRTVLEWDDAKINFALFDVLKYILWELTRSNHR